MRLALALFLSLSAVAGCARSPRAVGEDLDRRGVEYPAGLRLSVMAEGLTAATALACAEGRVFVADRGGRGQEVRVQRFDPVSGNLEEIYPARSALVSWFDRRPRLHGPVGGLAFRDGELFATARDADGFGLVVAFDLRGWGPDDGRPPVRTVVSQLPARGDHPATDLAFHPITGRLFFGVGSATNSGVVGVDNWRAGWLKDHRDFHDRPLVPLKIDGYRFDTEDPRAGPLNPDKVNTSAFNPFGSSAQRIPAAEDAKPTAAVYSVDPAGGDLRVEAHGVRHPAGLAFNAFGNLWATNQGMELRGTRPVKDDPDTLLRIFTVESSDAATWYGWPDFSADLRPITDDRLQPPRQLLARTGYSELNFLIDRAHPPGGRAPLATPDRAALVTARFPALSGAHGVTFVPEDAPGFDDFVGDAVVALRGDRAPFATSGLPLTRPQGREVAVVDVGRGFVRRLVYNSDPEADPEGRVLVRPIDVAFDDAGSLWILDGGTMRMRGGQERYGPGTGRLLRLAPDDDAPPATRPSPFRLFGLQGE